MSVTELSVHVMMMTSKACLVFVSRILWYLAGGVRDTILHFYFFSMHVDH